jgi:DNA polymerase kappa
MIRDLDDTRDLTQCICHVDMDAFYASVEELENPELKSIPMAVGDMSMLCTSNYLARKYGVRSAMPGFIALKLCPELKLIPLHFPKYRAASEKVRAIFRKYDPNFLPMSLDEVINRSDHTILGLTIVF